MGINSTEVSYSFGQLGSMMIIGSGAHTPPTGKVFVAITMITDCQFDNTTGLVADNDVANGLEYMGTGTAAHDAALSPDLGESGTGGDAVANSIVFPKGVTIYGRWTSIDIASSQHCVAYIGN